MSRSMVGKFPETAGVPAFPTFAVLFGPLIDDIETVAGGADKGTGATSDTAEGGVIPERVFKMIIQPPLDFFQIERGESGGGTGNRYDIPRLGKQYHAVTNEDLTLFTANFAQIPPVGNRS